MRAHNDDTLKTLATLSEINLTDKSLSIAGLDLSRRRVMFEQKDFQRIKWSSLIQAMKKAQSPDISAETLQGSKNNGAFFREFLNQRLSGDSAVADGMRVM